METFTDGPSTDDRRALTTARADAKLTFSVTEVAHALGISRTLAYDLARRGELRTVKLGRRLVVPRTAVEELLAPDERR